MDVKVLTDINFSINKGEFASIIGKSGCGKSTLLYILSTMHAAFDGDLMIDSVSMKNKLDAELAIVRNKKIGFVFQFHYLLNDVSFLQKVMLPGLKLAKLSAKEIQTKAYEKLKMIVIQYKALISPNKLSGGEKQRVAIARAFINETLIIMGDEPTGILDKKNSEIVFDVFKELVEVYKQYLLIVTHDNDFAKRTHRIIEMEYGQIIK